MIEAAGIEFVGVTKAYGAKSESVAVRDISFSVPAGTLTTRRGPYTLLQKDRMFSPHMLIVPVGSIVHFPNEDPFYHNVFSLFDGTSGSLLQEWQRLRNRRSDDNRDYQQKLNGHRLFFYRRVI